MRLLREFLERNTEGFNYRGYLVAKLQFLIVAMLLASFLRIFVPWAYAVVAEIALSACYFFVLLKEVRADVGKEFAAYAIFFGALWLFIGLSWAAQFFALTIANAQYFLLLLIALVLFVVLFRVFFGRNYTKGRVLLAGNGIAVVETGFDLLSFSNAGRHIVETVRSYAKGDGIRLKKGFFSKKYRAIE